MGPQAAAARRTLLSWSWTERRDGRVKALEGMTCPQVIEQVRDQPEIHHGLLIDGRTQFRARCTRPEACKSVAFLRSEDPSFTMSVVRIVVITLGLTLSPAWGPTHSTPASIKGK